MGKDNNPRKTKERKCNEKIKNERQNQAEVSHQEKKARSKKLCVKKPEPVKKFKMDEDESEDSDASDTSSSSSDKPQKNEKWINKERILIFATRGISHIHRHLMIDVERLLPHSRHGNKMERRDNLYEINEICSLKNCNKCILFDGQQKKDLYMWIGNVLNGPTAKFSVENIYTTKELKLAGNCLKGSRAILSFDETFLEYPHYMLLKELFTQVFSVPNNHPKSQPYVDHIMTFSILDHRIWFRNYQILPSNEDIAEIGPRFVLNPIKILDGSFCGRVLWENPKFISPTTLRRLLSEAKREKQLNREEEKKNSAQQENRTELSTVDVARDVVSLPSTERGDDDNITSSTSGVNAKNTVTGGNKSNYRKKSILKKRKNEETTTTTTTTTTDEVTKKTRKLKKK